MKLGHFNFNCNPILFNLYVGDSLLPCRFMQVPKDLRLFVLSESLWGKKVLYVLQYEPSD
jgi:hypothetical protein